MRERARVWLVTDRRRAGAGSDTPAAELAAVERLAIEALEAGVDAIHLREPDAEAADIRRLADRLVRAAHGRQAVFVNDRVDVASAAGAAVHLRGDGPPTARVRPLVPAGTLVSRAVHAADDVAAAEADVVVFGHVFETMSKPGRPGAGLDALRAVTSRSGVPVIAIGGITPARAVSAGAAGADGVAAISVFLPAFTRGYPGGLAGVVRDLRAGLESGWTDRRE